MAGTEPDDKTDANLNHKEVPAAVIDPENVSQAPATKLETILRDKESNGKRLRSASHAIGSH